MGHIHKRDDIQKVGNTFYAYPGIPEGRGFDECGENGILAGEIGKNYCKLTFEPISIRKYLNPQVDISGCTTVEEVCRNIEQACPQNNDLYKVELIGSVEPCFKIRPGIIANKLKSKYYYIKISDKTNVAKNLEIIRHENTLEGFFIDRMLRRIEETEDPEAIELLRLAMNIGLRAFEGEVLADEDH